MIIEYIEDPFKYCGRIDKHWFIINVYAKYSITSFWYYYVTTITFDIQHEKIDWRPKSSGDDIPPLAKDYFDRMIKMKALW
jgi:hypothetical protein